MNWFLRWGKKDSVLPSMPNWQIAEPEQIFIEANIKRELHSLIEDVLEPYSFEGIAMDNVYDYARRLLVQNTLSIKDLLYYAMMGQDLVVNLVRLHHRSMHKDVLILGEDLEIKDGQILKTVVFEQIYCAQEINLLRMCFAALWYAYKKQERANYIDGKLILRKHGFNALFLSPKNAEEQMIVQKNREQLVHNVKEIIEGRGGIIDAKDDFGLVQGSSSVAEANRICVDQIYLEIARILKVPITRLIGRSPAGLNATGESDARNYELTLKRIRSNWLEPFCTEMAIVFHKKQHSDLQSLQKIIQIYQSLEKPLPDQILQRLQDLI